MPFLKPFIGVLALVIVVGNMLQPAKADTFYGTLVPMTTAVTLSASVTELTIGTTTSLTYGGGDGTGGYRFNNSSTGFCSVSANGVVSANYPGQCTFTVTRLASGKYIDTTSNSVSIMALPEPDKSVISTPEPDPTPTPRATRSATPTPTANPISTPAPVTIRDSVNTPVSKPIVIPLAKKVTGLKAQLAQSPEGNAYKFLWDTDKQAISYSITVATDNVRTNYESKVSSIEIKSLQPGNYTIEISAIDAKGKLSNPSRNKFTIANPATSLLTTIIPLNKPSIRGKISLALDKFVSQATLGYPVNITVEYPKRSKNSLTQAKSIAELVSKYLKDNKPGMVVEVSIKGIIGEWNFVTVRGSAKKQRPTLLISRG
jgi:hypothetical protein